MNNDNRFNGRFNANNDVQDHFSSLLSPRPFIRQQQQQQDYQLQQQPFYYNHSTDSSNAVSPFDRTTNNILNSSSTTRSSTNSETGGGGFNHGSIEGHFKESPSAYFNDGTDDDDVIAAQQRATAGTMNHRYPNRHIFQQQQQQQQEFPTFYHHPRFGSMDRLRNNSSSSSGASRSGNNANNNKFGSGENYTSSFFDQPRDEFERKFFENPTDDQFEFDRRKFFDNSNNTNPIRDEFEEQRRKFFENSRVPTKMSTPPPLKPEWGFAGPQQGGAGSSSAAAPGTGSIDRMDTAGHHHHQSSPFASLDRRRAPFRSETVESAPFTSTYGGSSERIIPIRVEGRRGGGFDNTATPGSTAPKPTPPFKPPDLASKGSSSTATTTTSREIPIFQQQQQQQKPNTNTTTTNAKPQPFKQQQQPERESYAAAHHHGVPLGGNFGNKEDWDTLSSTTTTAPKLLKFEPDALIQKLSEAPNLSNRLAGKITRFDEFSDVLSQLPKQPNRPSVDRELDEKLAPLISSGKFKPVAAALPADNYHQQLAQQQVVNQPVVHNMIIDSEQKGPQRQECLVDSRIDSTGQAITAEAPPTVQLFDDACKDTLNEFYAAGQKIGGEVAEITNLTKQALDALRSFLWNAAGSKKPTDQASLNSFLKPISEKIESIQSYTNAKRASQFFNHLSAISEGIPALGWITISPTPVPYVKEMVDAAQFYVNRVLKDFKEKDQVHSDWVKLWIKFLSDMQAYIKQNHTTGLVWNTCPGAKAAAQAMTDQQQQSKPKGPPGPPPPPPPSYLLESKGGDNNNKGFSDDADSRAALFADINKGLDITKTLKKVTDDMKTHKNPDIRQSSVVPATATSPQLATAEKGKAVAAPAQQRPPKVELEGGKKWVVEYVKGDKNVVVNVADMKQVAYIYKCSNSVIQFKGKINSITMDSCDKTSIVFEDLVSCIEVINCQRAQVQSLGKMPTITIQKTDGCQIYLCNESLNTEIVTSKSSEMNVMIPNANGEYDEHPLPEQYKTILDGKKLKTTVVDIA